MHARRSRPAVLAAAVLAVLAACGSSGKPDAAAPAGGPVSGGAAAPKGNPSSDLIPRDVFFGNPDRASVQISPDGKMLSWLQPDDGVLNVYVAPRGQLDQAKVVTADKKRPVRAYQWAFDNKHILYLQDTGGDEDWHVFSVDVATGKAIDLTPFDKVAARIDALSDRAPGHVLIAINDRNPQLHDVYRVEIATGKRERVIENPGFVGFTYDEAMTPRLASKMTPDGGLAIQKAGKQPGEWVDFLTVGADDMLTTGPVGFDKKGTTLYLWDSRGRDTAGLVAMDLRSGKQKLLVEDPRADGSNLLIHPTERSIQAAAFTYARTEWKVLDPKVAPDLEKLEQLPGGEFAITSRTLDDRTWVVAATADDGPVRYYVWDRAAQKEQFLFVNRKALEGLELARMHPVVIKSRDGLDLVSYLSLPVKSDTNGDARPEAPLPMVLLVHGGPWARDDWGFDPIHQLLANRGYAVLSVNFRGSTGFGKTFLNAANREWAGKMHDDLLDALAWAVKEGVAGDTCIMGGSYGGYATLVGLTFTPEVFKCGVDIVGPSNILTLLGTIPPYWQPMVDLFKTRVGDFTTSEGKQFLTERSPLSKVDQIKRPLLIGQGANDPRVKQAESDQIVKAMQEKKIPVTYVLFPDEGHGFARPENSLAFFAVTEAFLSAYLGGQYQPLGAGAFEGSSISVPTGSDAVPGLVEALGK